VLAGADKNTIVSELLHFKPTSKRSDCFGAGNAVELMVEHLKK
jgi:hypothetical protein